MEKIKAGLIGCGRIGYTFDLDPRRKGIWTHAGAYNASDKVEFSGVYDANETVAAACAKKYGVKTYEHASQLVWDCDVISVCVPETLHQEVLQQLMPGGGEAKPKVIWVEKPFTGDFQTARWFVDYFANYNCHMHVNYQRRHCDSFKKLKSFGQPNSVQITYVRGLYNTASHFVDMILGLYGEPERVILVKYNSDFVMDYGKFRVNFTMLEGINYNICDSVFYYSNKAVYVPTLQTNFRIKASTQSEQYSEYRDLQWKDPTEFKYEPMLDQVETIFWAIKRGHYYDLNNGLGTLKILEQVSSDKGKFSL